MEVIEGVEEFLDRHGIKGQKWGVRNTRRVQGHLDKLEKVSKTKVGGIVRVGGKGQFTTPRDARRKLRKGADIQKRVNDGKKSALSTLLKVQGIKIQDLNFHQND